MTTNIVIITDSDDLARTLGHCLECVFGDEAEAFFMTYSQTRLSNYLVQEASLFILEVLGSDGLGYRALGINAGEKFSGMGKSVLFFSDRAVADRVNSLYYWDAASSDHLPDRVNKVLQLPPPGQGDFDELRKVFAAYCRSPLNSHG